MNTPLISIVIPVFNRQSYIEACLASCVAQHYRPLQIIIVDDGSTDASQTTILKFIEDHQHIDRLTFQYLYQEHHGAPQARNAGLAKAEGAFIQFLDSDDLLAPEAVHDKYTAFTAGYSVVFGDSVMIDAQTNPIRDFLHSNFTEATAIAYLANRSILTSSLLFRKECFERIQYDPSIDVMQDRDICIRLLVAGFKFKYIQKIVEYHRLPGDDNISSKTWVYTNPLRYLHAYTKIYSHVSGLDQATVRSVTNNTIEGLWRRGRQLVRAGKYAEAHCYFTRAVAINAGHIPKSFLYRITARIISCIHLERLMHLYKTYRNRIHV